MQYIYYGNTLYHHGIKGQKWGIRKYQNEDGSLTAAGREHYGYGQARDKMKAAKAQYKSDYKAYSKAFDRATGIGQYPRMLTKKGREENKRRYDELTSTAQKAYKSQQDYKAAKKEYKNSDEYKARQEKIKKAAKIGLAVAGTALAVYGTYKVSQAIKNKAYNRAIENGKPFIDSVLKDNTIVGWDLYKDGSYAMRNSSGSVRLSGQFMNSKNATTDNMNYLSDQLNRDAKNEYDKSMEYLRGHARNVSSNTVKAAKYLYKNRKKRR